MEAQSATVQVDPIARWAFALAFVVMIIPLEGDLFWSFLLRGRRIAAAVLGVVCFLVVFIPFAISCRRLWRQRPRLRGKGYLAATAAILAFNVFGVGHALIFPPDPLEWHR